ncbi:hypothetical protein SHIRM173S_00982 [Streptomyces hirsutus]
MRGRCCFFWNGGIQNEEETRTQMFAHTRVQFYALAGCLAVEIGVPGLQADASTAQPVSSVAEESDDVEAKVGAARIRAALLGQRVEVTALRTESSTAYVNPDGSVTEESSTGPTRVKDESGTWRDVDTTLVRRDGVVQPMQAAADISFSDGGSGALAEVSEGSHTLGIGWDGDLPRPTLEGNTATYSEFSPTPIWWSPHCRKASRISSC